MCVLSVMWALERLNRRTSLPLVYFPAGRLSAVYFCWRCDSSSFLAPRCSLRPKTTLSPFSLSNLSLFYLCYVISLFPSCGSHQDVIYFHLYYFWIPASISFNWKKSEKVGIRNVSHKKNGRLWRYKCSHFTLTGNLQADQTLWCHPCLPFFSMRLVQLCPQRYDNHSCVHWNESR